MKKHKQFMKNPESGYGGKTWELGGKSWECGGKKRPPKSTKNKRTFQPRESLVFGEMIDDVKFGCRLIPLTLTFSLSYSTLWDAMVGQCPRDYV